MTRSTKKAIINLSKPRDNTNHRRERHKIKELLSFDPDSDMLDTDSKELGNDEWGTKMDLEFQDWGEDWEEERDKMRRK